MKHKGFSKKANRTVVGDVYKRDGQFFIITEETDSHGFKMVYEVEPKTIEIAE